MALIVEDGSAKTDAEAYIAVADADTYFGNIGTPSAWSGASSTAKEQALREAARWLDAKYRTLWIGKRRTATQALEWPRLRATTRDAFTIAETVIPAELGWANAELAARHIASGSLAPDLSDTREVASESLGVGPIELSSSYASGGAQRAFSLYEKVDLLLGRILLSTKPSGIGMLTLERA